MFNAACVGWLIAGNVTTTTIWRMRREKNSSLTGIELSSQMSWTDWFNTLTTTNLCQPQASLSKRIFSQRRCLSIWPFKKINKKTLKMPLKFRSWSYRPSSEMGQFSIGKSTKNRYLLDSKKESSSSKTIKKLNWTTSSYFTSTRKKQRRWWLWKIFKLSLKNQKMEKSKCSAS